MFIYTIGSKTIIFIAMNNIFSGVSMINGTVDGFNPENIMEYNPRKIYFVRTNADGTDGYLYFNGKRYGTGKSIEEEIKALLGYDNYDKTVKQYIDEQIDNIQLPDDGFIESVNGKSEKNIVIDANDTKVGEYEATTFEEVINVVFEPVTSDDTVSGAIKKVETNVSKLIEENIKTELVFAETIDVVKNSVGLNENLEYEPVTDSKYINDATSLVDADKKLDDAIKALSESIGDMDIDGNGINVGEYEERIYDTVNGVGFYSVISTDTVNDAIGKIEDNMVSLVHETLDNERVMAEATNSIKESAGFNDNLLYESDKNTNYIKDAISLSDADKKLDTAIKNVSDALSDTVKSVNGKSDTDVVIDGNDAKVGEYTETVFEDVYKVTFNTVNSDDTINSSIKKVDENVSKLVSETLKNERVVSEAINNVKKATGLSDNLGYVQDEDANYISDAKSLVDALKKLDVAINGKKNVTKMINHGTSDTTFVLTPNDFHVWGTVGSLTLTFATPEDNTVCNEYMFQFTCGSTATTLSLPSSLKWASEPNIEANKTHQVSIINNLAVIGGF